MEPSGKSLPFTWLKLVETTLGESKLDFEKSTLNVLLCYVFYKTPPGYHLGILEFFFPHMTQLLEVNIT